MASLFISYSRRDIEAARQLTEAFKGQDLDFWIDWEGIPPTVDWWSEIQKGIEEADIFLFLLSPDSAASKVCKLEIEHATKNGKRLIPVVVRDLKDHEAPAEVGHLNWIFLRETDDFNVNFSKLITAIKTDYEWVQTQRELQVKALEWQRSAHDDSALLRGNELHDAERQLATNSSKEPHPTDLQREYVFKSRQASDRQRRRVRIIAVAVGIALAALAVFGFVQAGLATANAKEAQSEAVTAQANAQEAQKQADIALSRQIAAQAIVQAATKPDLGMLLVQESLNRQSRLGLRETFETINSLFTTLLSGPRPLKYLRGHTKPVLKVAISPDSEWIASASADGTIRIWDIASGLTIYTLAGHDGAVNTISFAPKTEPPLLASGGQDGTVRLWTWKDKSGPPQSSILTKLNAPVHAVVFSPTEMKLAMAGEDKIVHVYDLTTHQAQYSLTGHTGIIYGLAFSMDGATLASTDNQNDLRLWDMTTGKPLNDSHPNPDLYHQEYMHGVTFSPDNSYIATGYVYNAVWSSPGDIVSQNSPTLIQHTSLIRDVAYSPDGKRFASASEDWSIGYCYITALPNCDWESVIYLKAHDGPVNSVAFSPDDKWLVSGGDDGNVIVWNALFPYLSHSLAGNLVQGRRWNVEGLAFSPDNKTLVSSNWDGAIRLWDVERQTITREFYPNQGGLGVLALSPDGTKIAFGADSGPHRIWNIDGTVNRILPIEGTLYGVAFSPDGKWLATDNNNGKSICLWGLNNQEPICQSLPENGTTSRFAFSPDSRTLASDLGAKVALWDLTTQPLKPRIIGSHDGPILSLTFSPDGKWLASGGGDYTIRLWALQDNPKPSVVIRNNGRFARSVAFSPDGRMLVSVNEDWTVRWWDVDTLQPFVAPLQLRKLERVDSVSFSPNGKWLATGSFDGIIDLWPGELRDWKSIACSDANRNLTRAEYARYIDSNAQGYDVEYSKNPTCPDLQVESKITPPS